MIKDIQIIKQQVIWRKAKWIPVEVVITSTIRVHLGVGLGRREYICIF